MGVDGVEPALSVSGEEAMEDFSVKAVAARQAAALKRVDLLSA